MGTNSCLQIVIFFVISSFLSLLNAEIRIVDPPSGVVYTQGGGKLHLKFISTDSNFTQMCHQVNDSWPCSVFSQGITPSFKLYKENNNEIVAEYTVQNVQADAAGEYKVTQNGATKSVFVHFVTIESKNGTMLTVGEEVSVSCSVSGLNIEYTIAWFKDGQAITRSERHLVFSNDTLTITGAKHDDVGVYACVVTPKEKDVSNNMTANAYIHSAPFIDRSNFERGRNLVQGDTVSLDCRVFGYPTPRVSWLKENEPIKLDNRTTVGPFMGIDGAKLTIIDLAMEDRAEYSCVAENEYNSTMESVKVSVKDKYAALWPFMGICLEVIILCAIIFIYERRRNKKNEEKEKTTEKATAQNGKCDDVRQRNKNTERA